MQSCKKKICTAGELRHKVNIQSSAKSSDDYGYETETWTTDKTVWAKIQPIYKTTGTESSSADQMVAEVTHRIMIRYSSGLTPANRIVYKTRVFDINLVRNVGERDRWVELVCKEDIS